ncbi:MAG: NADH:ubiquinone reductase (Na(+)-transporting) subunit F [Gammaproteobacteria bacterium]
MNLILVSGLMFAGYVVALVIVLLVTRRAVIGGGEVRIIINDDEEHPLRASRGGTLLNALRANDILVPAACGGQATCGMCRVKVTAGGGVLTPAERSHITRSEARQGDRLACMTRLRQDLRVEVPPEILSISEWVCAVESNHNVATFIKELRLKLPPGDEVPFAAGGYVVVEAPPHTVAYRDFDIGEEYRDEWDEYDMWQYVSTVKSPVTRAYSMANYPAEKGIILLNVRIASPPPEAPNAPPGKVSSYIFGLNPGDQVKISGPYGEFHVRDSDREMVFIGGGAGMAPMRSHIFDQFRTKQTRRRASFWYGARSLREAFYIEDFDTIAAEHDNFDWHLVLSDPKPEDHWTGPTGFVHQALYDHYLSKHPTPEEIEYYLCGPPAMMSACFRMLDRLGVDPENIFFDDFGA